MIEDFGSFITHHAHPLNPSISLWTSEPDTLIKNLFPAPFVGGVSRNGGGGASYHEVY